MASGSDPYKYFKTNVLPPGGSSSSPLDSPPPSPQSPIPSSSPSPSTLNQKGIKFSASYPKIKKCSQNILKKTNDALSSLISPPSNVTSRCTETPSGAKIDVYWDAENDIQDLLSQMNAVIKNGKLKRKLFYKGNSVGPLSLCVYPSARCL